MTISSKLQEGVSVCAWEGERQRKSPGDSQRGSRENPGDIPKSDLQPSGPPPRWPHSYHDELTV